MKKPSRSRSPTKYIVPAIVLIMVFQFGCAIWNTSIFDLGWICGTFVAAGLITFAIIAPQLLPIEDNATERRKVYGTFYRFLRKKDQFIALVRDGQITHTSGSPLSTLEPIHGTIVADGASVVALRTSTGLSRVAGAYLDEEGHPHSGVIFTEYYEEIDSVIDLRPQVRRKPTTAQTRDGITVDVAVIAFFAPRFTRARKLDELSKLQHPSQPPSRQIHYPPPFTWRRASIIQMLNTRRVERSGEHTRKTEWHDRIMEVAIPRLRDLISDYTVDELTAWSTTDKFPKHPRYVIRDNLVEIVRGEMDADDELHRQTGIDVRFMAVSPPMPPDAVIQRRIQAWVEEWRKKEADVFAQAEAEAMLTRELARAQAQGEMTARINDIFQEAQSAQTASGDLVMLRFLEVMDKMSKDPATRALLTHDALKILNQLRNLLKPDQLED